LQKIKESEREQADLSREQQKVFKIGDETKHTEDDLDEEEYSK